MAKITCPKCHHILGDCSQSIHARINCKTCREAVDVNIKLAPSYDYFKNNNKENK